MELIYFVLLIWLLFALIAMNMAARRGRNKFLAFFSGLIFGILSLAYYAVVGDTLENKIIKEHTIKTKLGI